MIYLDTSLQKKILHVFHYALNPVGYLALGKSETVTNAGELFNQIERKYKVYTKKKDSANKAKFELRFPVQERSSKANLIKQQQKQLPSRTNQLEKVIDDILLQKYVPASVVVNEDLEILQFRGSTSLFLEPAPGKASFSLLKMARGGLGFELRNAITKSSKSLRVIKKAGIELKLKTHIHQVSIEVVPLKLDAEEKIFLVIFEETQINAGVPTKPSIAKDKIVKQLESELEALKEDMKTILEDQQAHVEEWQSANEEIVSSNEELQSINEELETSKEEVESSNEELATINNELQITNEHLSESYEYSEAVFDTIREAVVVLDNTFRVKKVNSSFLRIFKEKVNDVEGRLIYDLGNRQWDIHKLRQLLDDIIVKNTFINAFEVEHSFPFIGRKIMLINARPVFQKNSNQQLILLAIEDITDHRQAELLLSEREYWFRNMANQAPVMIWVAGVDKRKNFFNDTWLDFTGRSLAEEKDFAWREDIHVEDLQRYMKIFNGHFDRRLPFSCEYRLRRADGVYRWVLDAAKPTFLQDGSFSGYVGSSTEIHDKKLAQEELEQRVNQRTQDIQQMNHELKRSNNELQQFAYVASHDLQEPLRKILTFADRLQKLQSHVSALCGDVCE